MQAHLTAAEIAAYIDTAVERADRRRIEAHLILCDACLDEVIAGLRHLQPKAAEPAPPP